MTPEQEKTIVGAYVGRPFVHGARGRDSSGAIDCYGLVIELYKGIGIELPDYQYGESKTAHADAIADGINNWEEVEKPEPYDVVVILHGMNGVPNHVGIMLRGEKFIHCVRCAGVVVSRLHHWKNKIAGFFRYKK